LAIEEALKRANVDKKAVDQVYMGCVLPASMGQAPDRQAALFAGMQLKHQKLQKTFKHLIRPLNSSF